MATPAEPTARNLRAAARLVGVGTLPQHATRAQIAGAIVGALQSVARPGDRLRARMSPQDAQHYRRERVGYYLALGFTQRAVREALANEDPPISVTVPTISRDASVIREEWKRRAVDQRTEAMTQQVAAWDARLLVLNEAWSHEMTAYANLRGSSRREDLVDTPFGKVDEGGALGAGHIRAAERLHGQIAEIEKQRRDLMGLDAAETGGTFREALIAKAEELGWPDDAIADVVAKAEAIIAAGLA